MKIIRVVRTVESCSKCIFRRGHIGHGECWQECSHPDAPGGYDNIIPVNYNHNGPNQDKSLFPDFCPGKDI